NGAEEVDELSEELTEDAAGDLLPAPEPANGGTESTARSASAPAGPGAAAFASAIETLRRKGFGRLLIDGRAVPFDEISAAALSHRSTLRVVVDRVQVTVGSDEVRQRLTDSIETAYL